MAAVSDRHLRAMPLVVGGGIVGAMAVFAIWLAVQRKYGVATLIAVTPLSYGHPFEGVIESAISTMPDAPVSIHIYGWNLSERGVRFSVGERVPPERVQRVDAGTIHIPFSLLLPDNDWARNSEGVRLTVRTRTWPLGWGARFLIEWQH